MTSRVISIEAHPTESGVTVIKVEAPKTRETVEVAIGVLQGDLVRPLYQFLVIAPGLSKPWLDVTFNQLLLDDEAAQRRMAAGRRSAGHTSLICTRPMLARPMPVEFKH